MRPRIVAFPLRGNAYTESLYAEFRAQGAEILKGEWGGRWLISNLHAGDVVHFHWPSYLYESEGSIATILRSFLRFLQLVSIIRLRTREVWWTAHNLMPHDRCRIPYLDVVARVVVIHVAKRVFVHGPEAERVLQARFPSVASKSVLIPLGNWIGRYPPSESACQARRNLKLPTEAFVYLFFGNARPYKNLEGLIEVFRKVAKTDDILLAAGRFWDRTYLTRILDMAAGDDRIRINHCFIPDDRVSDYFVACNAVCMPYREILTSGTAMLALGYGRPVLSINRGFLRDLVRHECGLLIEPGDPEALADGLLTLRARSWVEAEIVRVAERFTFSEAARISLSCVGKA